MRPVLFRLRGRPIHAYPAMLYVGLVAGVFAGNAFAHAAGLDAFRVFVATFVLIFPALIGSRLLFVAMHWSAYRRDLRRIWNRAEGGAAQYGGLLLAVPLSVVLLRLLDVPFGAFWDVGAITILVGMIFTRVGCLLNGCCCGRPSRAWWALYLPNHSGVWTRRIPTPCLEGAWAAVLLIVAIAVRRVMPFPGAIFLLVTGGYGCGRLVLESTREHRTNARLTLQHAISLLLIVTSVAVLAARWPK
jgi:phosphatidylglycerol---prolipoprotein diacylglyceryl transferase